MAKNKIVVTDKTPAEPKETVYYGKKATKGKSNEKWWTSSDEDIFNDVFLVVAGLSRQQQRLHRRNIRNHKLYGNFDFRSISAGMYSAPVNDLQNNRMSYNVVKSIVDTIASKLNQARPRPLFLTIGGDFKLQRKAKNLTKFMDGIFDEKNIYEKTADAGIDSQVYGTGCVKVYEDGDEICIDRVIPLELVVDEMDAMYRQPTQMHQRRNTNRDTLIAMFPEFERDILALPTDIDPASATTTYAGDTVLVIESWHLPSGPNAKDGKHAICVRNKTLFVEEWTDNHFPFVFIRWTDARLGFWGTGVPDDVVGLQVEINKLLQLIQMSQDLLCNPRILVDAQSTVVIAHINDEIGAIIKYTGNKPEFVTPSAVSPEVYRYLDNLIDKAYALAGVSQLSASSIKPQGVDAGIALRTLQDVESDRYHLFAQRYDKFHLDIAQRIILAARMLDERGVKMTAKARNKKNMDIIKWKDVDLSEDNYSMALFPTNGLPREPAGKLATIQEMMQAGLITPDRGMDLLNFPDLDEFMSLENAAIDSVKYAIEEMSDGKYVQPEPFDNFDLATKMAQAAYLRGKANGMPEEYLDLFRTYIDDIQTLITQSQTPPTQPDPNAAPPGPETNGLPVPPPVGAPGTPIPPGTLPLSRAERLPRSNLVAGGGLT